MKSSNRIICSVIGATIFFLILSTSILSAENISYSWYIKRNGKKRPQIQDEQKIIYKYDGYFIDKKLGDEEENKVIYLTFDLGYANENAEKIVNVLEKKEVTAAFFVLDNVILNNTDLIVKIANNGNLICNHTKNHKNLCNVSETEIQKNLTDLEKIYEERTGMSLAKYFRFPEGKYSESALSAVQKLGYKTVFWSFAYDDWDNNRQPVPNKAIKKILANTHNGAVFLFHPTSATNAEIFPLLIDEWRKEGYSFGTLDELVK